MDRGGKSMEKYREYDDMKAKKLLKEVMKEGEKRRREVVRRQSLERVLVDAEDSELVEKLTSGKNFEGYLFIALYPSSKTAYAFSYLNANCGLHSLDIKRFAGKFDRNITAASVCSSGYNLSRREIDSFMIRCLSEVVLFLNITAGRLRMFKSRGLTCKSLTTTEIPVEFEAYSSLEEEIRSFIRSRKEQLRDEIKRLLSPEMMSVQQHLIRIGAECFGEVNVTGFFNYLISGYREKRSKPLDLCKLKPKDRDEILEIMTMLKSRQA